jgi:nucleotide-binding universal stress UspA family protein
MSPVTKISRVLVGVDFDDASASALKMAGVLATAWDADITVFHAATQEMPAYFTAAQIVVLEAEREQGQAVTADQIRLFSEQHVARAVRVVVGEGPPQDGMLGMAASFDLIVVGTHRPHDAGGLARSLRPSSVTHRARYSWCLRPPSCPIHGAPLPFSSLGVMVPLTPGSMSSALPSGATWFGRRISTSVHRTASRTRT